MGGALESRHANRRMRKLNMGDLERGIRIAGGFLATLWDLKFPKGLRVALILFGTWRRSTGFAGRSPVCAALQVSSIDGPPDHPGEAEKQTWLTGQSEFVLPWAE